VLLSPADVHPHQHLGPVGGVHPAGTGADADQGLALVVLPRQQGADFECLDFGLQRLQFRIGLGQCVLGARALFLSGHLVEHRQVVEAAAQALDPPQLALGVGQLAGHPLCIGLVVPQLGVRRIMFERLDLPAQAFDIEHPFHRGQRGVQGGEVRLSIEVHEA
jgi:hypothetical protein